MTWLGLLVMALCLYLAFRLLGALLKLLMLALALVIGYALIAPHMGWPGPWEIAYVMGPDVQVLGPEGVVLPETGPLRDRLVGEVAGAIAERVIPASEGAAAVGDAEPCQSAQPEGEQAHDCR